MFKKYLKRHLKNIVKKANYYCDQFFIELAHKNTNFSKKYFFIDLSLIGDILVTLPYYERFFKEIPDNDLQLFSLPTTANILKKVVSNTTPVNLRQFIYNPYYRIKFIRGIGKSLYCAITHPNRTEEMEYVCLKLNSIYKVAYEGEYIYEIERKKPPLDLFSHIIKSPYNDRKITHISNHLKVLFEGLNYTILGKHKDFSISKEDYLTTFKKFNENFYNSASGKKYSGIYIVILPDASVPYRRYPLEKWEVLLNELSIPKDIKIIQLGLNKFPLKHPNLIDLTGKTTLEEAMSIVMNASLVIGNEAGLTHLSYLSGVPTVCILGGGHFERFLPWEEFNDVVKCVYHKMDCFQCGWRCKYVNLRDGEVPPCIENIEPERIAEAVETQFMKIS